jgi:hypothetical protein
MPKLSNFTASIDGWDNMTADEKLAALSNIDFPEAVNLADYVKKSTFDKTASDLAAAKKAINDSKPEADKMADALKEANESRDSALRELAVIKNQTEYLKLGYTPEQAKAAAEALTSGDMAKMFEIQMQVSADAAKRVKTEYEKNLVPGGGTSRPSQKDDAVEFAKMLAKQRNDSEAESSRIVKEFGL